jgi:hypothetical protein
MENAVRLLDEVMITEAMMQQMVEKTKEVLGSEEKS